jgi:sugar phosphate isomerase/epimerase
MVVGDMPLTDKFKLLQDLGFDGVEISGVNGPKAANVLKARDATGLNIHGVSRAADIHLSRFRMIDTAPTMSTPDTINAHALGSGTGLVMTAAWIVPIATPPTLMERSFVSGFTITA